MKSSLEYKLLIVMLSLLLSLISFIPAANAATSYAYDQAGNMDSQSSSQSVLTTLTLSGNPSLTYNGSIFAFDLTTLTLTGTDQSGNPFSLTGQTVTWNVVSGPATVYGSALLISNSGEISITANVSSVSSNTVSFTVSRGTPTLTYLTLSGSPSSPLVYNDSQLNYNLSNLTLAGFDQFNNSYSVTGQTVTWAVYSGPATVSGSALTITGSGQVGVTASVYGITSNVLTLNVYQGLPPPGSFQQTSATPSSICVSWSAVTGAASYNIFENGALLTNVIGSPYTYPNLSSGTSFTLAVCAVDFNGNPGAQSSITGYTQTAAPSLTITALTTNSVQVSWTPLYGASSYNSYIYNGSSWVLNNSNIQTTSYTFSGLSSGTAHTLGIAGVDSGTVGAIGQISVTTHGGSQMYTTPGSFTFTVPSNVTQIFYIVQGAGGGGGGCYRGNNYAGGGGAGGAATGVMSVTPGQQINGNIGAGGSGAGATSSSDIYGAAGGSTTFGSITCIGGQGGSVSGYTASGGTGSGGTVNVSGAFGDLDYSLQIGNLQGGNSVLGVGGAASYGSGTAGGTGAGGGGAYPYLSGGQFPGGVGGNGAVYIWW